MDTIKKYKVGQKIEYNFGHKIADYRLVEIEFLNQKVFRFKNITGNWPRNEKYIKQPGKKSKVITGFTGNALCGEKFEFIFV